MWYSPYKFTSKTHLFLIVFILIWLFIPSIISDMLLSYRWVQVIGQVETIVSESEFCTVWTRSNFSMCDNFYAYVGFNTPNGHWKVKMRIDKDNTSTVIGSHINILYDPYNFDRFKQGDSVDFSTSYMLLCILGIPLFLFVSNFLKNI